MLWVLGVAAGALTAAPALAGVDDFNAFLLPPTATGDIGDTIDVTFEVDATAMQFNAYEITIQFDPAIVSFLDVSEGTLFTSLCGSNFTNLSTTDSTVTYAHSILCGGVSADGPGVLSNYRFVALADGTSPVTVTSDPDRSFFDDGLFVWPLHPTLPRQVIFTNNEIVVGNTVSVPTLPQAGLQPLEVRVSPNPARDYVSFSLGDDVALTESGLGRGTIEIFDLNGRLLGMSTFDTAADVTAGNGFDLRSLRAPVSSGMLFYRLRVADRVGQGGFLIVR